MRLSAARVDMVGPWCDPPPSVRFRTLTGGCWTEQVRSRVRWRVALQRGVNRGGSSKSETAPLLVPHPTATIAPPP